MFYLLVNGYGRGSRPRTYNPHCPSGKLGNQSKFVHPFGFCIVPRLTPINIFRPFPKENVRELETERRAICIAMACLLHACLLLRSCCLCPPTALARTCKGQSVSSEQEKHNKKNERSGRPGGRKNVVFRVVFNSVFTCPMHLELRFMIWALGADCEAQRWFLRPPGFPFSHVFPSENAYS